jgi:hypothetical protein
MITNTELKDYNNWITSDTAINNKLTDFINQAVSIMEGMTNQPLQQKSIVLSWFPNSTLKQLNNYYLIDYNINVDVTNFGYYDKDNDFVEITDYRLINDGSCYLLESTYENYLHELTIDTGYTSLLMPNDLKAYCTQLATWLIKQSNYQSWGAGLLGLKQLSENQNGILQTTQYEDFLAQLKRNLAKYIRVVL